MKNGWPYGFGTPPDQEHYAWLDLASMWRMETIGAKDVTLYQFQMLRALLAACKDYEDKNEEKINRAREGKASHTTHEELTDFLKKHETEPKIDFKKKQEIDIGSW